MTSETIEVQVAQLIAAGWKQRRRVLWQSPNGTLHRGPHGAWKIMRQLAIIAEFKLLPCPFCASTDVRLDHLSEPDDWFIRCGKCEIQQIANYAPEEAARRWNERVQREESR